MTKGSCKRPKNYITIRIIAGQVYILVVEIAVHMLQMFIYQKHRYKYSSTANPLEKETINEMRCARFKLRAMTLRGFQEHSGYFMTGYS